MSFDADQLAALGEAVKATARREAVDVVAMAVPPPDTTPDLPAFPYADLVLDEHEPTPEQLYKAACQEDWLVTMLGAQHTLKRAELKLHQGHMRDTLASIERGIFVKVSPEFNEALTAQRIKLVDAAEDARMSGDSETYEKARDMLADLEDIDPLAYAKEAAELPAAMHRKESLLVAGLRKIESQHDKAVKTRDALAQLADEGLAASYLKSAKDAVALAVGLISEDTLQAVVPSLEQSREQIAKGEPLGPISKAARTEALKTLDGFTETIAGRIEGMMRARSAGDYNVENFELSPRKSGQKPDETPAQYRTRMMKTASKAGKVSAQRRKARTERAKRKTK